MKKMKKTLLGSILLCGIFLSSCKKDNSTYQENEITATNNIAVSVTPKGYLKFTTTKDIVELSKKLFDPKTKESVLTELTEKGFKNRKSNITSYSSNPTSPYDLIFNSDGLLEVENVIMKITDDDKFIYTLKEKQANSTTFNNLVKEVFDTLTMNKINVDRNAVSPFNFAEFMALNPNGQQEVLSKAILRKPMFGTTDVIITQWVPTLTPGTCYFWQSHYITVYVFWVKTDSYWGDDVPNSGYTAPCP